MRATVTLIFGLVGSLHAAPFGRGKFGNSEAAASNAAEQKNVVRTSTFNGGQLNNALNTRNQIVDSVLDLDDSDCDVETIDFFGGADNVDNADNADNADNTDALRRPKLFFNGRCRGWAWFETHLVAEGFRFVAAEGSAKMEEGPAVIVTEEDGRGTFRRRTFQAPNRLKRHTHHLNGFPLVDEQTYEARLGYDNLPSITITHMTQDNAAWKLVDWKEVTFITGTAYVSCDLSGECMTAWADGGDCDSRGSTLADLATGACYLGGGLKGVQITVSVGAVSSMLHPAAPAVVAASVMGLTKMMVPPACNWLHDMIDDYLRDCEAAPSYKGLDKFGSEAEKGEGDTGGGGDGTTGGTPGSDGEKEPSDEKEPGDEDPEDEDKDPKEDCDDKDKDPNNDCDEDKEEGGEKSPGTGDADITSGSEQPFP